MVTAAFIDIENFRDQHRTLTSVEHVISILRSVHRAGKLAERTYTVAAASPQLEQICRPANPSVQWRFRAGRDGADLALLDEIGDPTILTETFDRVVIASGDGIFTDTVRSLRAAGAHVTVIAVKGSCSAELATAANQTLWAHR